MEATLEMPARREFPKAIEGVNWREIQRAVEAGIDLPTAAQVFNVSYEALRKRAQRENWLHPRRLEDMAAEQASKQPENPEPVKSDLVSQDCPSGGIKPETAITASQALSQVMSGHRERTILGLAKAAEKGVERLVAANLPVEDWNQAKIVADIAMKLHNVGSEGAQVNILVGDSSSFGGPVIETGGNLDDCEIDEDE